MANRLFGFPIIFDNRL